MDQHWPRRLAAAVTLFVAVVTTAVTASAQGPFGSPFLLSGAGTCYPAVAIDATGDAVFAWTRFNSDISKFWAEARTRSAAGVFGPILTLSGTSIFDFPPRVAIDAAGNAIVAWSLAPANGPTHAQFRTISAAGMLGPITNLSNVLPIDSARVAMNASGEAIFAWHRPSGAIETRTRSAAGVLGPVHRVSLVPHVQGDGFNSPEVAIDAGGDAVFAWVSSRASQQSLIQARRRSAAGALGQLYQNLDTGTSPRVGIDGGGNAIVAWINNVSGSLRVEMRTLSGADVLGPQTFISQGSKPVEGVEIAMNAAGDAVFAYYLQPDPTMPGEHQAVGRGRLATGGLAPQQTLSTNNFAVRPVVAIDAHGRSVFAWNGQARTRSATGSLGGFQNFADPHLSELAHVAMNARGDAAVTWCQFEVVNGQNVFTVHGAVTAP